MSTTSLLLRRYKSNLSYHTMSPSSRIKYLKLSFLFIVLLTLLYTFNITALFSRQSETKNGERLANTTPSRSKTVELPPWASLQIVKEYSQVTQDIPSDPSSSCQIPKLQPFHPSILKLASKEEPPLVCENEHFPLLFNSTLYPSPRFVPAKSTAAMKELAVESCCFRKVHRMSGDDKRVVFSRECRPLSLLGETGVPPGWEFVGVECEFTCSFFRKLWKVLTGLGDVICTRFIDFHTFPSASNSKPSESSGNRDIFYGNAAGGRQPDVYKPQKRKSQLNVMILGLDAVSRMNFLRSLPEVHWFLKNNLSAVEMQGYHKIGENTFPNIAPMLTNTETVKHGYFTMLPCVHRMYLDSCPFIWKKFKNAGYRTLFAEDAVKMAIFNMHSLNFDDRPTDHYFRPVAIAASDYTGHETRSLSKMCYGPRPAFNVMMDYMEKMAISMERSETPFFQFGMSGSLTHEFINGGRFLVNHLMESLQRLEQQGIFKNTVLILLSDHGSRLDEIRSLPQGFLEDRFPFMYVAMPPWFRKKYPIAYSNLVNNTKRLTTAWDVYQTLLDILNPEMRLSEKKLEERENMLKKNNKSPGISLFLPIPLTRTCENTAGIPEKFCSCNMHMSSVSINASIVAAGATHAVEHINGKLTSGSFTSCAPLTLTRILHAEKVTVSPPPRKSSMNKKGSSSKLGLQQMYRIVFETSPGAGNFEALLEVKTTGSGALSVSGSVARLDLFKDQSWCVKDTDIKQYCYCLK